MGSSSEGKDYLDALSVELLKFCEPHPWDLDIFEPSRYPLEDLEQKAGRFDYAVFILHPDDYNISRGEVTIKTRDNVVFEMGLFTGVLGRSNVLLLEPNLRATAAPIKSPVDFAGEGTRFRLPTDFLGITTIRYEYNENVKMAMRVAAIHIRQQIEQNYKNEGYDMSKSWPLRVAILSKDTNSAEKLHNILQSYTGDNLVTSKIYANFQEAKAAMDNREIDGAFFDIFSFEADESGELISYARRRHREIAFSIFGTYDALHEFPGFTPTLKSSLEHYWRLAKDENDDSLSISVEDMMILFFIYKLSGGAFGEAPGRIVKQIFKPDVIGSLREWRSFFT